MEYRPRLGIAKNKSAKNEPLVLIVVFRWVALIVALVHFLLVKPIIAAALLLAAAALIYTLVVTVAVVKRTYIRPWFAALDSAICGLFMLAGSAALPGFGANAVGPVLLSSFLFDGVTGLMSATVITVFFIAALYQAMMVAPHLTINAGIILSSVGYIVFLYMVAIFIAQVSLILKRHRDDALRLEENVQTLSSIYEVASSISSKFFLDDILESVVDHAKHIIKTDKTVLHLVDLDSGERPLNRHMVAVRGRRSEHPESWWRAQIEDVADVVIESGRERLLARAPEIADGDGSWLLCVPVKVKDKPVGLLSAMNSYDKKFTENDIAALTILASFAAVAIENARLINRAQMLLVADERNRIAKEMHDGLAQSLFSLVLNLQVCQKKVEHEPQLVKTKLAEMQTVASQGLTELRRYIYDLRPKNLEDMGLIGAVNFHLSEINKLNGSLGRLRTYGNRRGLSPRVESCVYRVVQEATNNIAKHAKVDNYMVSLKYLDDRVELIVRDQGRGFDVQSALADADKRKTFGLLSMRERIAEQGGELEITSSLNHGTEIRVSLPVGEIHVRQG